MNGISLFSSAGIGELFLNKVGINIILSNEIIERRCSLHRKIFPSKKMLCGDIQDPKIFKEIDSSIKKNKVKFMIATPPCQGFSLVGKNKTMNQMQSDPRNYLFLDILKLIKLNIKKNKNYDHLLRVASNNKMVSISLRKRPKPKSNFKLKLVNYKRVDAVYKNLKYKKILKILSKLDVTKFDIALYKQNKILETGTSNLLFIKSNKIFSPNKDCYKGTTIKFFSKKVKIKFLNIFIKNINSFDEILVVGSGKGIVSVSSIDNNLWKRKSLKVFNKLLKIYKSEIKNN